MPVEALTEGQKTRIVDSIIRNVEAIANGRLVDKNLAIFREGMRVLTGRYRERTLSKDIQYLAKFADYLSFSVGFVTRVLPPNGPPGEGYYPDTVMALARKESFLREHIESSKLWIKVLEEKYPGLTDVENLKSYHDKCVINIIEPRRPYFLGRRVDSDPLPTFSGYEN